MVDLGVVPCCVMEDDLVGSSYVDGVCFGWDRAPLVGCDDRRLFHMCHAVASPAGVVEGDAIALVEEVAGDANHAAQTHHERLTLIGGGCVAPHGYDFRQI